MHIVLGLLPGTTMDFSNLTSHGGFVPLGSAAVFIAVATIIFSFVGSEIVTIAAAESAESEKAVVKAVNSVIVRIMTFYVGSVFIIVSIVPWNDSEALTNPYVGALKVIGIPGADMYYEPSSCHSSAFLFKLRYIHCIPNVICLGG